MNARDRYKPRPVVSGARLERPEQLVGIRYAAAGVLDPDLYPLIVLAGADRQFAAIFVS